MTVSGMVIIEDDQMQKSKPLKESWVEDVPLVSKMRKLELKLASLLVEASSDGDLSLVKNLITKHSVSADETRDRGVTALHMASRNGHIEIVKYLMKDLGANPDQTDDRGRTAIYFAVKGYCIIYNQHLNSFYSIVNASYSQASSESDRVFDE